MSMKLQREVNQLREYATLLEQQLASIQERVDALEDTQASFLIQQGEKPKRKNGKAH